MKLEIKEIDGVPVTGIPDGSRTDGGMPHLAIQTLSVFLRIMFYNHFMMYCTYTMI